MQEGHDLPQPIEYNNQRILTSQQIADLYGTDVKHIKQNFSQNKDRYVAGKHYFYLEGEELKRFKNGVEKIDLVGKRASSLYLWTEKGALFHAKSLGTDKAWDMYDRLVDGYYRMKEKEDAQDSPKGLTNTLFMERGRLFAEKTKIPNWMFCIFEEITTTFHYAELRDCKFPEGAVPDSSVGSKWCENVRSHPEKYDTSLMQRYPHCYPDRRKEQWAFIYPITWLGDFRIWFKEVYIPVYLPKYLNYLKVPQEEIEKIMRGFGVPYQPKIKKNK